MPAIAYSTRPSEAATSTMQTAMKIVEMRIMSRATPSSLECPKVQVGQTWENSETVSHGLVYAPPFGANLSTIVDSLGIGPSIEAGAPETFQIVVAIGRLLDGHEFGDPGQ